MCENRFYICKHCGNIVGVVKSSGVPIICCGDEMVHMVPNSVEASVEKHLPVVTVNGDKLSIDVGAVPHPMTPEHVIEWIYVQTARGGHRIGLAPDIAPEVEVCMGHEKPVAVYAYCNIHGLWMTEL